MDVSFYLKELSISASLQLSGSSLQIRGTYNLNAASACLVLTLGMLSKLELDDLSFLDGW